MTHNLPENELPNQLSSVDHRVVQELRNRNRDLWRSNYHEASIYIEEGLNNDKFENHPRKRASKFDAATHCQHDNQTSPLLSCIQQKPDGTSTDQGTNILREDQYTTIETYILVHNKYFYQLDLAASIILLLLALVEAPAVDGYELNPTIHAGIEVFALGIIAIELLLKFRWMGPRRFFRHGRTVTKLTILLAMNVEAIIIFLRRSIHARYSRALRPIFLIDNHYCHGLRRVVRQIFQSLPPIIDMFTLVLFFMFVFSIFGFYLFASNNYYFSDMSSTVGNLLILATTANLPDVMMPSYSVSRWSAIFFVLFVIIHLFLLTNLTMAAVYEIFTRKEKEKFHKLLLHRRKACQEAFKLLVSRRQPNRVQYRQFMGLMRYLNRKCSMFDAYLIFKALDTDKSGSISLEEFYQIYDFINLEWKLIYPEFKWYDYHDCLPPSIRASIALIEKVLKHRFFEWSIDLLIAAQAFLQFFEATTFQIPIPSFSSTIANANAANSTTGVATLFSRNDVRPDSISTYIFITIFFAETALKCLVFSFKEYWHHRWNRFDLIVLLVSLCGLLNGSLGGHPFGWVIVLRVLRLMRLFEFKRRYRDMWQTLTYILLKRFVGMTCVVMILYYFFAIVGMELLGDYDLRNCCKNTSLESQFKYDNSTESAKYYLNDFGDLVASYLTLFSMSSSTYWLTTMSAYAIVSQNNWIRLFFALYYLCSIIVMNIVVAFILESFLFHIHYRNKMGDNRDDSNLFTVSVTLSSSEVEFLCENLDSQNGTKDLDKIVDRLSATKGDDESLRKGYFDDNDDETKALLGKGFKREKKRRLSRMSGDISSDAESVLSSDRKQRSNSKERLPEVSSRRPTWYLIYQAEQIRNKFSFTMKMYADEVEGWLAEAERADQDEMSLMINRNQIRAEHVAMARLARRNLVEMAADDGHLLNWTRPRSWSTSGSVRDMNDNNNKSKRKRAADNQP